MSDQEIAVELAGQPSTERLSAAEAVVRTICRSIKNGEFPLGERLPSEAKLAALYDVSRPVVREALRSCAGLGLTETKSGSGTFVVATKADVRLPLGQYTVQDLYEARPHIEAPAASLAALRRSASDLTVMRQTLDAMSIETNPRALVDLDAAFHIAIAHASRNRVFERMTTEIRDALAQQSEILTIIADRHQESDEEHRRILAAIETGDPGEASAAMLAHLDVVHERILSLLEVQR